MPLYKELSNQPLPRVGDIVRVGCENVEVRGGGAGPEGKGHLIALNLNGDVVCIDSRHFRLFRRLKDFWVWGLTPDGELQYRGARGRQFLERDPFPATA